MRADMLTIWRCVSPSRPDHIYRYGLVWTATVREAVGLFIRADLHLNKIPAAFKFIVLAAP